MSTNFDKSTSIRGWKSEHWFACAVVVLVIGYMFLMNGYSTGYKLREGLGRATLWEDMQLGYKRDEAEWGFGWFVPFAVIVMAWITRSRYQNLSIQRGHWLGLLVLLFAFLLYFAGYKANQKYIGFVSGQFLAAGIVLWFLGPQWFWRGFWLWILFGMVWPWRFLIGPISAPLQLVMVEMTSNFMTLIGDPVDTRGTAIHTTKVDPITGEGIKLNVAAACSGLRSLFALAMIAMAYGYLSLQRSWKRILLLAFVPVLAILGNFVRMMMLYGGAQVKGSEWAIGTSEYDPSGFHIGAGLAVFMVALLGMVALVDLLNFGPRVFRKKKAVVRSMESGKEATD